MELLLAQITPLGMIGLMEFTNLRTLCEIPLLPALTNAAYHGTLLWWVRAMCCNGRMCCSVGPCIIRG